MSKDWYAMKMNWFTEWSAEGRREGLRSVALHERNAEELEAESAEAWAAGRRQKGFDATLAAGAERQAARDFRVDGGYGFDVELPDISDIRGRVIP